MSSPPAKYKDTLNALAEAKDKEAQSKQRLAEKREQAMAKNNEPVLNVVPVVYPPLGDTYFPQVAKVEAQRARAMQLAQEESKLDAEVEADMAKDVPAGMPVSSTRKLLEKQYRREMKMRMTRDMAMGGPPGIAPSVPPMDPMAAGLTAAQMDAAVLQAADQARMMGDDRPFAMLEQHRIMQAGADAEHFAAMRMAEEQAAAAAHFGSPGAMAQARDAAIALQSALEQEKHSAPPSVN